MPFSDIRRFPGEKRWKRIIRKRFEDCGLETEVVSFDTHEDTEQPAYPCPPLFANNGEDYYSSAGMLSYLERSLDFDRTVLAINIDSSQEAIAIP